MQQIGGLFKSVGYIWWQRNGYEYKKELNIFFFICVAIWPVCIANCDSKLDELFPVSDHKELLNLRNSSMAVDSGWHLSDDFPEVGL